MINQECKVRPVLMLTVINLYFFLIVLKSKCSGSCNSINDPYAKICVPNVAKSMKIKASNLMPRTNETRYIEWHKTFKCKCRLDPCVFNNKQRWIEGKFRCDYKELNEEGSYDKGFISNPSNCECECYKSCGVGESLDY